MKKFKIAILSGDGVGPEVVEQAGKVLNAITTRFGHQFEYCHALIGAVAIEQTGDPLPHATLDTCMNSDAILFGSIGGSKYNNDPTAKIRPEQGLLRLRKSLGLYANLRPIKTYPNLSDLSPLKASRMEGVDMLIVRELTGGIYFGESGRSKDKLTAYDTCTYSTYELERIAKVGFEAAGRRKGKLTLIDKASILESSRLWREVVQKMALSYPEIEVNYMFVDNAAMQLMLNPAQFDVIVTSNMFGDILSDASSVLAGSLGMLPSSSIGINTSLFGPIHGSYPEIAGEDKANPIATILSTAMLLDSLHLNEEAELVREAVKQVMDKGLGTEDIYPIAVCSCSEIGDIIADIVENKEANSLRIEHIFERISTII